MVNISVFTPQKTQTCHHHSEKKEGPEVRLILITGACLFAVTSDTDESPDDADGPQSEDIVCVIRAKIP